MWYSCDLLKYMSMRPKFYGRKWKDIKDAEHSYLAKCFTDSVLKHLDLGTQVMLPFVHLQFSGQGDPCGVKIDSDFCFSDDQIRDLMNFLCTKDCDDSFRYFLSDYVSFKIEMYLLRSISLYKNWISLMRDAASNGDI